MWKNGLENLKYQKVFKNIQMICRTVIKILKSITQTEKVMY